MLRCRSGAFKKRALCSLQCRNVHGPVWSQSERESQPQNNLPGMAAGGCSTRPALCHAHQRRASFLCRPLISSRPPKPRATAHLPPRLCPDSVFPMGWQRPPDPPKWKSPCSSVLERGQVVCKIPMQRTGFDNLITLFRVATSQNILLLDPYLCFRMGAGA